MRLIADREQLVGTALAGFGTVANDLFGRGQPYYNDEIPQREQDIEQAQFLLKEAGLEGATFTLSTSNVVAGMLESATVFAEQAKAAGITIELENIPADAYFAERYLKYAFAQSSWSHLLIPSVITRWLVDGAPFNETHWNRPEFDARFREAQATLDETARRDIYFELQQELWDEGGFIIWGDQSWVDAASSQVTGISPRRYFPLGSYDFRQIQLT
jgi:peptide/nickel transport system substrate-binding protein